MLLDRRLARLAVLCALVPIAGACSMGDFMGPPNVPESSQLDIVALNGSGVRGSVTVFAYTDPRPSLWVGVQGVTLGARYPMHLHAGNQCGGAAVPVAHDLGAPAATGQNDLNASVNIVGDETMPAAHLRKGYYFDVHAPGAPSGTPIGCAVFVK